MVKIMPPRCRHTSNTNRQNFFKLMSTIDNLCPHGTAELFLVYLCKYFCNKTIIGNLHCRGCFYLIFPFLANNIFTYRDILNISLKRHAGGLQPLGKKIHFLSIRIRVKRAARCPISEKSNKRYRLLKFGNNCTTYNFLLYHKMNLK